MKKIILTWQEEDSIYGKAMVVVYSDHDRFVKGTRFDFGFMQVASREGFIIEVLP